MTSVVPADRVPVIQQKREICGSIRQSRKRKLKELYRVATVLNGIPNFAPGQLDAPTTDDAEAKFLDANDILKGRKLNASTVPPRPKFPTDSFTRHVAVEKKEKVAPQPNHAPSPDAVGQVKTKHPAIPASVNNGQRIASPTSRPSGELAPAKQSPILPASVVRPQQPVQSPRPAQPVPVRDQRPAEARQTERQQIQSPASFSHNAAASAPGQKVLPASHEDLRQDIQPPSPAPEALRPTQTPNARPLQVHPDVKRPSPSVQNENFHNTQGSGQPTPNGPTSNNARAAGNQPLNAAEEPIRPAHTLPSPSFSARMATTPAALEAPKKTDPQIDGSRSEERPVATSSETKLEGTQERVSPTPAQKASASNTSKELEAQLLRDSADAAASGKAHEFQPSLPVSSTAIDSVKEKPVANPTESMIRVAPIATKIAPPALQPNLPQKPSDSTVGASTSSAPGRAALAADKSKSDQAHISFGKGIRQRSVSEVLSGESSKELFTQPQLKSDRTSQVPITPTSQSPRPRARSFTDRSRTREKSRLAGVIFGKQPQKPSDTDKSLVHARAKSASHVPTDDYFTPLFIQGFSSASKWMKPLEQILHHAHKTVSTPDAYLHINESQACKVLKRVYHLQQQDKWSLRQPKRCPEPTRQTSQWDVLLQEMKWMRTDFRQERRWKTTVAQNLVYACAEWIAYPENRRELQVNAVAPEYPPKARWVNGELEFGRDMALLGGDSLDAADNHATPDLISSADTNSPMDAEEEPHDNILDTIAPSAIFTLDDHEVVFGLSSSPHTDRLLEELPLYGAPLKVPDSDIITPKHDPDAHWKREALPLSKFVEGRLELKSNEPPRKRSRYQHAQEDGDDEPLFDQPRPRTQLEPENPDVALFRGDSKAMRDRLHAGHQFRPPSEHTMPFQTFYESRSCSQWTISEDDELRTLVREYSYNWSLISSMLSTKSIFPSGAERRTPWECFERWVMLEGLPHDMSKTQYFKLWQNRIDQAQQVIRQHNANALTQQAQQQQQQQQQAQQQAQQTPQQQAQQNGSAGPVTPIIRKRLSLPVKVERRRNQKHLTMIDAMRKLAKKRETAVTKQQHAATAAQMRKQQEQPQPRAGPIKTPREYSIMRWERDQAMAERLAERMAQHQQQRLEAQRRAALQARAQQGQAAQMLNGQTPQVPQNTQQLGATHPLAGVNRMNAAASQMVVNGQARPRMPMQPAPTSNATMGPVNGGLVPPMQMNGNGQVQMPVVNGQARMTIPTQPDLSLVLQAQRISEQQRQAVQMRQVQQQNHGPQQGSPALPQNSPPASMRAAVANGVNQKNYMNNAQTQALMAQFNAANNPGLSTPPAAGLNMPAGQSSSPRPNASMTPQIHQTFVSQLQNVENQIRQSHPNTPQEVVRQMATQVLQSRHNSLTQSAMNAAAGGQGQAIANGPHQYAQLLRAQQQAQAQAAAAANAQQQAQTQHQRASSGGSATPPVPTMPK